MNKKVVGVLLAAIVFSFIMVYVVYTEKTAMDNLEYSLYPPYAELTNLEVTYNDIYGTILLRFCFTNPTSYDTPPFRIEFNIYIADEYAGHGYMEEIKVKAHDTLYTTTLVSFSLVDVSTALAKAILTETYTLTIIGHGHARVFLGLIPVSKPFTITVNVD